MKKRDIRLELKIWGSVLDCQVTLEEVLIGLWVYDNEKKIYYKDLAEYKIDGPLDVEMIAKGKNGASSTLTIKISGQPDETIKCVIKNGSTNKSKSITIV